MKKAFDQTIRDLKREVNKKVLKVPSVEQKTLDATSNEPWGPHGSLLADIAQATRNYHEYQMIMAVLWKRLNDTGKNWRHVYKALTVLEYLVAHGSERVIDEIREHAYQISTLSDFQYIDSSGRDQGNNVRRKSQSLVQLVNDKERIQEVRQKAASNRDKFRTTSTTGGMYRPGSGGYGDDRYEYDDRNGNGREREWSYRDDERYGRYGDSYSREGDRYGRESEEQYGSRYGDDESRGRPRSEDGYGYGLRSRSSDRDGDRPYDDDDRNSARGSSVRGDDHADGRPNERKFSDALPSYEESVGAARSPTYSDRDGEIAAGSAPQSSSPIINGAPQSPSIVNDVNPPSLSPNNVNPIQPTVEHDVPSHPNVEADGFDEFDPRGSFSATIASSTSNTGEMDLLGSLSDAFTPGPLAIMPATSLTDTQPDSGNMASNPSFSVASGNNVPSQSFEDPFGDSPFKAFPSNETPSQPQNFTSPSPPSFYTATNPPQHSQPAPQKVETPNLEFSDTFSGLNFQPSNPDLQTPPTQQYVSQEPPSVQNDDVLAGILPPAPLHNTTSLGPFPTSSGIPSGNVPHTGFDAQPPLGHGFMNQVGPTSTPFSQTTPTPSYSFSAPPTPLNPHLAHQGSGGVSSHQNNDLMGDMFSSSRLPSSNSTGSLALVPLEQPSKEKFEPKSTVWADTLSRGLVDLNISGPKTNPLSDIGIDFESLNRKEKRMEKPTANPTTSNVAMGKAMGSGSGIGRAGIGGMRPPQNPIMGSGMGMGTGMGGPGGGLGMGMGMGMGGYGSMNQRPMGMSMGGMNGMGMGMNGMNMGMAQGMTMQPPNGYQPPNNPMMGRGGYQQPPPPYGGGAYR